MPEEIGHTVTYVKGVESMNDVRARRIGHKLYVEVSIAVQPSLTVEQGHDIVKEVKQELYHHMDYLSRAMVHVDPADQSGKMYHAHA